MSFAAPVLAPGKLELKYLFSTQFANGSIFVQTPEDKHPHLPGRNAFYELLLCDSTGTPLQHPDDSKLITRYDIELFQLEDSSYRYLVDLRDGHFEVQHLKGNKSVEGTPFFIKIPPVGAKLKLFYFKRRRHNLNVTGTIQEDLSIKAEHTSEVSQECEYHFGWETEDKLQCAEMILV